MLPNLAVTVLHVPHLAVTVLYVPSPDGTTVVSAAADETLRFWHIFGYRIREQFESIE